MVLGICHEAGAGSAESFKGFLHTLCRSLMEAIWCMRPAMHDAGVAASEALLERIESEKAAGCTPPRIGTS